MKQLWATKSVQDLNDDLADTGHGLKRSLSLWALVALGIGAVIGAGIFVITGTAAAHYAGPAIVLSFVLAAFACALAGLCYAEFAAMIPAAGSSYTYAYLTVGELVAWMMGWTMVLEYMISTSTVAVSWSGYLSSMLAEVGLHLPAALASAPLDWKDGQLFATGTLMNLPAVLVTLLCAGVAYIGMSESAKVNNFFVVLKVAVIIAFIVFGIAYINTANWTPFIPAPTGEPGQYGFTGIVVGAGVIFFSYIGFEAVSTAAQEAKNPQRDMPRGILISLAVCTALYIAMALVMTGIVPFKELGVDAPIALAIDRTGEELDWLKPLIKIGALAGLTSVILVMSIAQPRIFYSMARDGLMPKSFASVHPRYRTPHINTMITGVITAAIAGIFPLNILGDLVSGGTLLAFAMVCIGVIWLRQTRPDLPRPFRTPWVPVLPAVGALVCLYLLANLPQGTLKNLFYWMLLGLVIYFGYGMRHSKLRQK